MRNREGGKKNELGTLIFSQSKCAMTFLGKCNSSLIGLNFDFEFGMDVREKEFNVDFRFGEFRGW